MSWCCTFCDDVCCVFQLLAVKEVDGTPSQDIFTVLSIGECVHLCSCYSACIC